ncbi:hypothetical protein INR49_023202 [Caranx melampygus]|nr:hypothetical protein INR49_023202 [Caranx melampygus]
MSSPRLGVVRDSMKTNPLLIKVQGVVGSWSRFRLWDKQLPLRDGGVAEAPRRPAAPDFLSLNRDAVRSGLVTAKELSQYRAQRGGARTKQTAPKQPEGGGVVPLSDLLSHQYGQRWIHQQLSRNRTSDHREQHRVRLGCIPDTRTSLLRRSRALPVTTTCQITPLHTGSSLSGHLQGPGGSCWCVQGPSASSVSTPSSPSDRPRHSSPGRPPGSSGSSSGGGCSAPPLPAERARSPAGVSSAGRSAPAPLVSSSFLIRDILSDCRPVSDPGPGHSDPAQAEQDAEPLPSGPDGDIRTEV